MMPSPIAKTGLPPAGQPQRSAAEDAVLDALVAQGEAVVARIGGSVAQFRSRLRFIDPGRQYIIVEPCADSAANAALLALPRALFHAEWGEWHIEFAAGGPERTVHAGAPVIRLRFPEAISSRRRRASERAPVPPQPPLRCVASVDDTIYFEATICDISLGGVGILQFGPDSALQAGTVIRNCRIEGRGRDLVSVDLEVRYTGPATLADGSPAQRAGCRFLSPSPALADLIREFFGKDF
ncbi:MAG: flagellar brake protein [Betaproteobacteria bacterium]|nr:flagellar brake protein [Betaproteobacteria bacterium]